MTLQRRHQASIAALGLPKSGRTYDLASGWWNGMPVAPAHPPFQLITYRTPRGERNQGIFPFVPGENAFNYGFISELVMTTTHAGTHLDALCHVTAGEDDSWYGGESANDHLGDLGVLRHDATTLPPIVTRGVLLDVATAVGRASLEPGTAIGGRELEQTMEHQGTTISEGDVILVRTGMMAAWPDPILMGAAVQAGISLDGARWLERHSPSVVGADNTSVEVAPSGLPGDPQPVHRLLVRQCGILLLEWVYLEDLARDGIHEFLFVCLPLPISGATGSLVRPLAII